MAPIRSESVQNEQNEKMCELKDFVWYCGMHSHSIETALKNVPKLVEYLKREHDNKLTTSMPYHRGFGLPFFSSTCIDIYSDGNRVGVYEVTGYRKGVHYYNGKPLTEDGEFVTKEMCKMGERDPKTKRVFISAPCGLNI